MDAEMNDVGGRIAELTNVLKAVAPARAAFAKASVEYGDALEALEKQLDTAEGLTPTERDTAREQVKLARLRNANERRYGTAGLAKAASHGEDLNLNRSAGDVNAADLAASIAQVRRDQASALTPSISPSHPMQVLQSVLDGSGTPAANTAMLQDVRQRNEEIPKLEKELGEATDEFRKQQIKERLTYARLFLANVQRMGVR